jgi:hypothetical protein
METAIGLTVAGAYVVGVIATMTTAVLWVLDHPEDPIAEADDGLLMVIILMAIFWPALLVVLATRWTYYRCTRRPEVVRHG